eukprot:NODE_2079_length_658_cov_89.781544_g2029_i0.p1 GENE.NODE_2079_length_658_cov_89.781544_g2029_i0~~NODE_2079_length_658_cov_89.781544_g2029_i0.p1  ORF type:complete len:178 (+),score=41.05 NODE_2079_length_658_cov_89.781544_g2029_i0:77-535(+)
MKSELYLLNLDQYMVNFKRFQTESDWKIELAARSERWNNILLAGLVGTYVNLITMPDIALERAMDSSVTPMRKVYEILHRSNRPWALRRGGARHLAWLLPMSVSWGLMAHWTENRRWNKYLQQDTCFGEMARQLKQDGKVDTDKVFLPYLAQ